ncbi:hypothetical protein FBUS_04375 [Fasciolopsis buskii]|uniref:Uncharacterized protein n=1 Tax=Fasciolopsis buskii TaxID=27845 RepID=A0A8E0RTL6_9TREM|nr:hypothetical protein FBUS_04375 [Fasciolopsis buski]
MLPPIFSGFHPHDSPKRSCCSDTPTSLTRDGFEWSIQHNFLAQVLLVQLLFDCFDRVSSTTQAGRIILMSEEAHRGGLPLLDISAGTFPWQFTHVVSSLSDWLDQYRWSKLFQLLYLFELQRRLTLRSANSPERFGLDPVLCACSQGSPLNGCCQARWHAIRAPRWMRPFLYLFWLIGTVFGQALDQVAATPVLCAVDDSLNTWKLAETDPRRRISYSMRSVVYVHQCRPRSTLLTRHWEAPYLLRSSCALWEATQAALSPYLREQFI